MLTLDLESPEVTETSVVSELLHALEILSESGIDDVSVDLGVGSVLDASLSVQEPFGDSVVLWLGEDVRNFVHLVGSEGSSSAVEVDLSDLAGESGESPSDTLDDTEGKANLDLSVHVGVHHTQKLREVVALC